MLDLTNCETYEGSVISDEDLATALKVTRTLRNVCIGSADPAFFDADGAIILSHAHAKIVELVSLCETPEEEKT